MFDLKSIDKHLGYFDQQVLASYRNEPDKYRIKSDYFEGELSVVDEYFNELESLGKICEVVSIRFGYRTLFDGNLAIVAWLTDLSNMSNEHVKKWSGFHLKNSEWTTENDERFDNWVRRYLEGDWDVDNGPLYYLGQTLKEINGLTNELVGIPLYNHEIDETLGYPAAENTHRYQDSHKYLYGYMIDGLEKKCISKLATGLKKNIKIGDKNTIKAIKELFPDLKTSPNFTQAVDLVSEQRRLASHGVRPPAKNFQAFSQFTKDLYLCLKSLKEIIAMIERDFGINGEEAHKRHEAMKGLPVINYPSESHYSIVKASRMRGKIVEKVEFGSRKHIEGVHESEAIIIFFTDGSIMSLDTGSNAKNLANNENGLRPEDFSVDFMVHWVPEFPKGMQKSP